MRMDINCDMGESFGRYALGNDAELLSLVTSANIACGFHAGDPTVMAQTVRLARQAGVAIGAHPGYPDLQGFGRRAMELSAEEVEALVLYQVGALAAFARAEGLELTHVKPHGALYNQAARQPLLAAAIARAVRRFSPQLVLVGLAGSALVEAGQQAGLKTAAEGFAERGYNPDGSLMARTQPGALIHDPQQAALQALRLATEGISFDGQRVAVDTICIHGDSPQAVAIAGAVRQALQSAGYQLHSLGGVA
jgi:UPF0271 protein